MKKSKTYQFLLVFNDKELRKLTKFINSSYFNNEHCIKMLFEYLMANLNKNPNKLDAYKYIYDDKDYLLDRLSYVSSQLLNLIKKYIEVEKFLEQKSYLNTSVLNKLSSLNKNHLYELEENIIEFKNKKNPKERSIDYQKNYLFELERLNFYAERKRTETKYIKNLDFNLDAYYLIEKLKTACTSITQQQLYKTEIKQSFITILIKYIRSTKLAEEIPLLGIYFNAYNMLITNKKNYFLGLKKGLNKYHFQISEINDAFILGLNFCIQQNNKGNTEFNIEIFEMYQTGIEKKILLKNKKLSAITFSNVVTVGLRIKRYNEVEHFIEKNKALLSGFEKKSYYSFNLAKVLFEKGAFEKVTTLYNEKLIKEILLNVQMRMLQIKAFYELGEIEVCESLILSTDQLLNRKGILAYHKKVFKNFIKFSKSLVSINSFDKKEIADLRNKITESDALMNKEWLLSKLTP